MNQICFCQSFDLDRIVTGYGQWDLKPICWTVSSKPFHWTSKRLSKHQIKQKTWKIDHMFMPSLNIPSMCWLNLLSVLINLYFHSHRFESKNSYLRHYLQEANRIIQSQITNTNTHTHTVFQMIRIYQGKMVQRFYVVALLLEKLWKRFIRNVFCTPIFSKWFMHTWA